MGPLEKITRPVRPIAQPRSGCSASSGIVTVTSKRCRCCGLGPTASFAQSDDAPDPPSRVVVAAVIRSSPDTLGRKGCVVVGLANKHSSTGRNEFRLEVVDALLCTHYVLLRDVVCRASSIEIGYRLHAANVEFIGALEVRICLAKSCGSGIL